MAIAVHWSLWYFDYLINSMLDGRILVWRSLQCMFVRNGSLLFSDLAEVLFCESSLLYFWGPFSHLGVFLLLNPFELSLKHARNKRSWHMIEVIHCITFLVWCHRQPTSTYKFIKFNELSILLVNTCNVLVAHWHNLPKWPVLVLE